MKLLVCFLALSLGALFNRRAFHRVIGEDEYTQLPSNEVKWYAMIHQADATRLAQLRDMTLLYPDYFNSKSYKLGMLFPPAQQEWHATDAIFLLHAVQSYEIPMLQISYLSPAAYDILRQMSESGFLADGVFSQLPPSMQNAFIEVFTYK